MKIVVVSCYFDPDYVRTRAIRAALALIPDTEVIVVKNKHHGLLRYPEVIWKVWRARILDKPDCYVLTFRGQEILPFMLAIKGKKPLIFDEFIVPLSWATTEKRRNTLGILTKKSLARISAPFYKEWLDQCRLILTDTTAHAELSAKLSGVDRRKYLALPVGTDETLFYPRAMSLSKDTTQVFYYGSMLPLHGLGFVLDAAEQLRKTHPQIHFLIVGGGQYTKAQVSSVVAHGAHIEYRDWIPFEQLPEAIHASQLCLAGPFGNTPQAQAVVTGKTYQFLACGVPALIGKSQATNLFQDKINCLLVPQGDANELALALTWAEQHPDQLKAIGIAGRELYEHNYSTTRLAGLLTAVLSGY